MNKSPERTVGFEKRQAFFIDHLNRIYCAKSHLAERLTEIYEEAEFADTKPAFEDTITTIENQIEKMDQIFDLLNIKYSFENCAALIAYLENSFTALQRQYGDHQLRDLMLLSYLYKLESVEMSSYEILRVASESLFTPQINLLVKESYHQAQERKALLLLLVKKYAGY